MARSVFSALCFAWVAVNGVSMARSFFGLYRTAIEQETAHCVCTVCGTAFDMRFSELPKMNLRKTMTRRVQVPGAGQSVTRVMEQTSRCPCPSCGTRQPCNVVNAGEVSDAYRKKCYALIVPRVIILIVGVVVLDFMASIFGWS